MIFADFDLARRLESFELTCVVRYALARRDLWPAADTAAVEVAGGCAFFFGGNSPLNEAKGLGMMGPVTDDELERMERVFHDRGVPAKIIVCPLADPTLLEGLARRGYQPSGFENVLYRALHRSETFPLPAAGIELAWATGEEAALSGQTLARGFTAPAEPGPEMLEIFAMSARATGLHNLLARSGGEPVGAASLLIDDDLAMLCGASTLPAFRNRGIQTALTHARLSLAASSGCELVTVGALPGSTTQRNAERLGFQVAYTKLLLSRDPVT